MVSKLARTLSARERAAAAVRWCRKTYPDDDPMDHIEEARRMFADEK